MPQLLTLSRAARIAGVSRSELQKKLRDEKTPMFEGKVSVSDLVALYPDVNPEHDPVFERIQQIKSEARPKSEYSDGWIPDPEVLLKRLNKMNSVLMKTKAALYDREQLLGDVLERLQQEEAWEPAAIKQLQNWLEARIQEPAPEQDKRAEVFARDAFYKVLAPSVRLSPSGHEFFVEGRDSILEAGLKAGLNMDYGCSSGNCGACKTKVLAGKVKQTRPIDFVINEQDRQAGHILACSWTAVTDLVLEAAEAKNPDDLPLQKIRASISRIERLAPDIAMLQLKTPRTRTLRFMAGQAVELSDDSGNSERHSLASCPCDGRNLQFFIEKDDNSAFSRRVFENSFGTQGPMITGPIGEFVLHDESNAPAVFIAIDEGFAPIRSLIEHAISIDLQESLTLVVSGWPDRAPHINNLCRAWRDALDHFSYLSINEEATADTLATLLKVQVDNFVDAEVYLAGPSSSVSPIADGLLDSGMVSATRLRVLNTDQLDAAPLAAEAFKG